MQCKIREESWWRDLFGNLSKFIYFHLPCAGGWDPQNAQDRVGDKEGPFHTSIALKKKAVSIMVSTKLLVKRAQD